jgi:hypothetical protein
MIAETDTKQRELEYQHADPYIVALLNAARRHLDLDETATMSGSNEDVRRGGGKVARPSVAA